MALDYKPISTIQIKRSETSAGLAAHILQSGELAWDMENNQLAVGDGVTPGGIILNVGVTPAIHYLANTSDMDAYHRFPGDVVAGMFLRSGGPGTDIGDAAGGQGYMKYLDFYDMEQSQRRHDVNEHAGEAYSIFYTAAEPFVIDGTTIETFKVFDGSSYTGDTTSRYTVRSLSYDASGMVADMSSTSSTYSLTVQWDTSVPVLAWRRLDTDIVDLSTLSGDVYDLTSSNHNAVIYANNTGDLTPLTYSGSTPGYVLKINDSTQLEFSRQRWKDITGYLKFSDFTGNQYIGKSLFRVYDTTTGQWSPFDFHQWFFGDTTGIPGMPTLGTGALMWPGESVSWLYGQPENIYGYTPGEIGTFVSTNPPYNSGARLIISSWDKRVWGDMRTDSIDLNLYSGIARIEVESIHTSYMRLKTRNYSFNIGIHDFEGNVGDSTSSTKDENGDHLLTYVGKATDRKVVMAVTRGKHMSVAMYNRNTTIGHDIGLFGSNSTNNDPDFQFDRYGMMHVYKAYMHDDNTAIYEEVGALDYPTCVLYSGYGAHDVVNSTVRDVYGIYINEVHKEVLSIAADGNMKNYLLACPSIVSEITSGGTTLSGETGGISIGNIDADSKAYGINITSVVSNLESGPAAYGIRFGVIKCTSGGGARGLIIEDMSGSLATTGIRLSHLHSTDKIATALSIGDYSSGDSDISNYGIWISGDVANSTPTDWTGAGGVKYAILTEEAAGTVRVMGSSWLQGDVVIGDSTNIGGTTYHNYGESVFHGDNKFNEGHVSYVEGIFAFQNSGSAIQFAVGTAMSQRAIMIVEPGVGYVSGRMRYNECQVAQSANVVITSNISFWQASTTRLLLSDKMGGIIRINPAIYTTAGGTDYNVNNISPDSTSVAFEYGTQITFLGAYNAGAGKSMLFSIYNSDTSSNDVMLTGTSPWDSTNGSMLTLTYMDWTCSDGSVKVRWVETART